VHVSTKAAALAKAKASQATLDSLLQLGGKGKEGECEEMEEMEEESGGDVKAAAGSASKGTAPKASVSASAPPMLFLQQVCVGGWVGRWVGGCVLISDALPSTGAVQGKGQDQEGGDQL
jgi:hypothetical protein